MKRTFTTLLAILLITAFAASPPVSVADGHEITVVHSGAESQFPDGIRFSIEASGPDEIDDIRVFFKKLGQTSRASYRIVEFSPGAQISGDVTIPSGKGGEYIAPGTRIEYSFEIRDTAGRRHRTEDQVFIYLDPAFDWGQVSRGMITVFYNYEGIADRAQKILEVTDQTLAEIGPILGIEPQHPLHIVAYTRYRDMVKVLPPSSRAEREQLITQGLAFTNERVLLMLAGDNYLSTAQHEFVHLLVADAAEGADSVVPFWLNEGLAEYRNTRPSDDYDYALERAIDNGTLKPLWHLQSKGGTPTDIIAGYGKGKSVVNYLISTYGPEKMAALFSALSNTFDIDAALREVYGFDQWGLDAEWRAFKGLPPLPPPEEAGAPAGNVVQPMERATSEPRLTPAPGVAPVTEEPSSAAGCNAPARGGPNSLEPALLTLVLFPLGLIWVRRRFG